MCINFYIHVYSFLHTCAYIFTYVCINLYIRVCIFTYMCAHLYILVYVHLYICVCIFTYISIHTRTQKIVLCIKNKINDSYVRTYVHRCVSIYAYSTHTCKYEYTKNIPNFQTKYIHTYIWTLQLSELRIKCMYV